MARRILGVLLLTCALLLALTIVSSGQRPQPSTSEVDTIIVVLKPAPSDTAHAVAVQTLQNQLGAQGLLRLEPLGIDGPLPDTPAYLGSVAPGVAVFDLVENLTRSPLVLRAEPDVPRRLLAIDPNTGPLDEEFQNGNQDYYFEIGVVAMWARGLTGMSDTITVTIAVIDSGVDLDHQDINDNLVSGYDFVDRDSQPDDESANSHGSMVAGVIGAEINNDIDDIDGAFARGVAGIGGGDALSETLGLRIAPLRVTTDTEFDCSKSALAIDYAIDYGAQVINMSYGGEEPCDLELDAVGRAYNAGIALVAGAGNANTSTLFYPAAYGAGTNDHLVIAVAGVYPSSEKADGSNYGTWVDVCAPYRLIRSITGNGGYGSGNGTSLSAPFVSGLIGVLMSNYGWSHDKTISVILATADNVDAHNPGYEGLLGAGRINADRASAMVQDVYLPLTLRSQP
jgi:subtilisin family serine protease